MDKFLSLLNHIKVENLSSCVVTILSAEGIHINPTEYEKITKICRENQNLKPSEIVQMIKEGARKHAQQ